MQKFHTVEDVRLSDTEIYLKIDGKQYSFKLSEISLRLKNATQQERNTLTISASGYGIRWPLIDEDLSIDGLLGVKHEPKRTKECIMEK
ncbi:MAG: DUF2442 domain-containing protein [Candidatus Jettenia caeni]|nr:MAG: DUF2442 domain-containing protein [Candidatus Jettenia caeni]